MIPDIESWLTMRCRRPLLPDNGHCVTGVQVSNTKQCVIQIMDQLRRGGSRGHLDANLVSYSERVK